MKKIIGILFLLSASLCIANDFPPTYERGLAPDGTQTEYLKVKARKNGVGEFSFKLRDAKEFPINNWQAVMQQDKDQNLYGLQLKAYRVTNGTLGQYPLWSPYLVRRDYSDRSKQVVDDKPRQVRYDSAGDNDDDQYRIYCLKSYSPLYKEGTRYDAYIDCSKVIYYYDVHHNIPSIFVEKFKQNPRPLWLTKE